MRHPGNYVCQIVMPLRRMINRVFTATRCAPFQSGQLIHEAIVID
jgi:hypothetical protein